MGGESKVVKRHESYRLAKSKMPRAVEDRRVGLAKRLRGLRSDCCGRAAKYVVLPFSATPCRITSRRSRT